MKKAICTLFALVLMLSMTVSLAQAALPEPDGTYRGGYIDPKQIEVSVTWKDGKFEAVKFRALGYKGESYLKSEDPAQQGIAAQYQALADYLVGKDYAALDDLYFPGNIAQDTDTFTAATVRSSKLISAIRDAFNRGLYALSQE